MFGHFSDTLHARKKEIDQAIQQTGIQNLYMNTLWKSFGWKATYLLKAVNLARI